MEICITKIYSIKPQSQKIKFKTFLKKFHPTHDYQNISYALEPQTTCRNILTNLECKLRNKTKNNYYVLYYCVFGPELNS